MHRRLAARLVVAAILLAGCTSGDGSTGPSLAEGGLAVYSVSAPDDLDTLEVAGALRAVLDLPDEADVIRRGDFEARIEGAGHEAVIQDRKAGSVIVSYSGPRFSNTECLDCPLLDDTDDIAALIDTSREILDAIGVDTTAVVFSEGVHTDVEYRVNADVLIDGATIDDLGFDFLWTHGAELARLSGGLFAIDTIGTVAPRSEADARAQADEMIGSERTITAFDFTYVGAFRDGALIVAPAYLVTTDLGTSFTVSGFTGELPS